MSKKPKPKAKVQRSKAKDQKPNTKDEIVAILLAAGQSRRMGAFKPLLPFGNTTVVRSCIDNLRAAGIQHIIVVAGHRASELKASLADLSFLQFAINPDPESEMSASIVCGVHGLPATAEAVLIALTDQPAIPPAVVQTIIDAWQEGAKLIIPQFNERGGHPVLIDLQFRDQLLTLDPKKGLRALFEAHRDEVQRLNVNNPYIARDLDTWDDYLALHEEMFGALPNSWTADQKPGSLSRTN